MTSRLEKQRPTGRLHKRRNARWYRRGYTVIPHSVWGDVPATQAGSGGSAATGTFTTLAPTTATVSSSYLTVTCTGTGFVAGTTIIYRLSSGPWYTLPTTVVSATSLTSAYFAPRQAGMYSFATQKPGEQPTSPKVMTVT